MHLQSLYVSSTNSILKLLDPASIDFFGEDQGNVLCIRYVAFVEVIEEELGPLLLFEHSKLSGTS
jgi:hypothetical protein